MFLPASLTSGFPTRPRVRHCKNLKPVPMAACITVLERIRSNLLPPARELTALTFSTDLQTLLLVGSGPQTAIRRYSAESGRELPQINRPSRFTTRAVLLPDNLHLLIAGWNPTRVINLPGGIEKPLPPTTYPVEVFNLSDERIVANREFIGHGADRVAYSPDGRLAAIAVVGEPAKIDLCAIPDLTDAGQIELPSRAGAVEFSASGTLLAASVADGTILVWDLQHLPPQTKPLAPHWGMHDDSPRTFSCVERSQHRRFGCNTRFQHYRGSTEASRCRPKAAVGPVFGVLSRW